MAQEAFSPYAQIPQNHAVSVYLCGTTESTVGQAFGPLLLTQYQFRYTLSGAGTFRTATDSYTVTPGQGFLICPDSIVSFEAEGSEPWKQIWFSFDGTEVAEILTEIGLNEQKPLCNGTPDPALEAVFQELLNTFEQGLEENRYRILAQFYTVAALLREKQTSRQGEKAYMEKALDYLHHNYTHRIRIEEIARYVNLDRTYLFKLFVKNIGLAPQEYLIRYRLERAAELMKKTNLSTAQVAVSCGFRDAPSFCKHFKARYNISPLQYRKHNETDET